jgi:hypothetical protein
MTPIGPVRVEYGWPVEARRIPFKVVDENDNPLDPGGERKEKGQVFFSIGYPF